MLRTLILTTVLLIGLTGCGNDHGWVEVSEDNPEIQAAQQEARDTYSEFVKLVKVRKPMTIYTVEVKYEEGTKFEYLELDVLKADENEITGVIIGYPKKVDLQSGATVTVPAANISDWRVETPEGDVKGGYVSDVRARLQRGGG